jgi:hypothetical protein
MSAQRFEQKGRMAKTEGLPQIGQGRVSPACFELRSLCAGSSFMALPYRLEP